MKKFRKKNKDSTDDFQKGETEEDLEAGAPIKGGKDDEFQDAKDEENKEEKIIWFPREKKYIWREEGLALR